MVACTYQDEGVLGDLDMWVVGNGYDSDTAIYKPLSTLQVRKIKNMHQK